MSTSCLNPFPLPSIISFADCLRRDPNHGVDTATASPLINSDHHHRLLQHALPFLASIVCRRLLLLLEHFLLALRHCSESRAIVSVIAGCRGTRNPSYRTSRILCFVLPQILGLRQPSCSALREFMSVVSCVLLYASSDQLTRN